MVDPGSNLSCGYYEVLMDYFDPSAGKARLALIKYQATAVSGKKGTLFVNPGTTTTYNDVMKPYIEAPQVGLEGLALSSYLPWDLSSAQTSKGSSISSLGTLAVSAPIHCEFRSHESTQPPNQLILRPWVCGVGNLDPFDLPYSTCRLRPIQPR